MTIHEKYIEKLNGMPTPGKGCHPSLLGAANLGLLAGIPGDEVFSHIRASIPAGKRKVSDNEINDAVKLAIKDNVNLILPNGQKYRRYFKPKTKTPINDGVVTLRRIIEQSNISDEVDLWEMSPIRIDWPPEEDTAYFLSAMFEPLDFLFIGERLEPGIIGRNIRTAKDWIDYFQSGGKTAPFIIVNPLTGMAAPKKTGDGETFRGDGNITSFRYCLVEFDNLTREEQIRFWTSKEVKELPIAALVDSGGKSIHGWIKALNINSMNDWQREIRQKLYEQGLIPLGVDSACSNPSRLSRLPGHLRDKKYQRILWLNKSEKEGNQ
jgi:hypothetical protein